MKALHAKGFARAIATVAAVFATAPTAIAEEAELRL